MKEKKTRRDTLSFQPRGQRGKETFPVASGEAEVVRDGSLVTLFLNGVESSCINVNHPEDLEFEYMQHMDAALSSAFPNHESIRAMHIGAAGCALPWSWSITHPHSRQLAIEIDAPLVEVVRKLFPLPRSPQLRIRVDDGRRALNTTRAQSWDVIVRDAFANGDVPLDLKTVEAAQAARDALKVGGLYLSNSPHGKGCDARPDIQAMLATFPAITVIADAKIIRGGRYGNMVIVARKEPELSDQHDASSSDTSDSPEASVLSPSPHGHTMTSQDFFNDLDRNLRRLAFPVQLLSGHSLDRWLAGANMLHDQDETGN